MYIYDTEPNISIGKWERDIVLHKMGGRSLIALLSLLIIPARHKQSLPPLQHTCSCQPYRRQLRMSTHPQKQTSVTHKRQENTAPQDQTPAQTYRNPRGMKRHGMQTLLS